MLTLLTLSEIHTYLYKYIGVSVYIFITMTY